MADYEYMPHIIFFTHRICTPAWEIIPQRIDFQDLTYVYGGKGYYLADGVRYDVSAGSLICLPEDCVREAHPDPLDPPRLYAFNYNLFDYGLNPVPLALPILSHIGINKHLIYSLTTMERVWALKEATYPLKASSMFLEIVHQLMQLVGGDMGSYGDPRVQQVADYVLANLQRQIPTAELARLVSLHPSYLNQLVQRHTGNTLRTFVNRIRINVAEDAIIHEKIPIMEAAMRCGFTDVFYFSKVFKRIKGYPPSHIKWAKT